LTADQYLQGILQREAVDTGRFSPVRGVQGVIEPAIRQWANRFLLGITPSGSFAKGTANHSSTDIDFFISLSPDTQESLKEIYESLFQHMQGLGHSPRRQNVSINVRVPGYAVDLVPGKRQDSLGGDHSLYRRRAGTWTKTNIATHIGQVTASGRIAEIRVLKLWRDQKGLDFPSFYLELSALRALSGVQCGDVAANVWKVLQYMASSFPTARIVDPANTNNVISDELSAAERSQIASAANQALRAKDWSEIVK